MEKKLYRINEISSIFSISKSTVWSWCRQGKIQKIKFGDRVTLFDIHQFYELFKNKED